ncbi:MAG TPA: cytochrome c3 family protein [Myxococcales bacterium]|nr:cytochrome c3 family protein [Myxococcales bacterium]
MSAGLKVALLAARLVLSAGGPGDRPPLPDYLQELFAEKGDDGKPILTGEDRNKLEALPPHTVELIARKMDQLTVSGAPHLKRLLSLDLSPQLAELVFSDNCIVCHTDPEAQKKLNLFSPDPKADGSPEHLGLLEVVSDVHFRKGLSCAGCHGGSPDDARMSAAIAARWPKLEERKKSRAWVVDFCGRCHSDPGFMRGFNPSLPTDQVAKYRESQHGVQLLQKGDSKAAQCVSCHGVHGIRDAKSPRSLVNAARVPETCGRCHADAAYMAGYTKEDGTPLPTHQLEQFKKSVHGRALLEKGDTGAPACNDCHGNHAAQPPQVASVSQVCRTCHVQNGALFDGSRHKKAFEAHGWPECEQCHGRHDIQEPSDAMISDAPDGLCGSCHAKNAADHPECNQSARYFRSSIDGLVAARGTVDVRLERLAELGLDVDPIRASAAELDEALVQARTRIHSFDRGGFEVAAAPGRAAAEKTEVLISAANDERRFRRNGLLAAIGFSALVALVLALKIRQLDRRG